MSVPLRTPWPPMPATTMFVTLFMGDRAWCVVRGACSGGHRGGVAFAALFFVFLELLGDEDARAPRDDHRQFVAFQAIGQQAVKLIRAMVRLDHMHAPDAERAGQVFDDELVGRLVVQRAARARVFLVARHRRGGVVEDDQYVAVRRRVIDHLHQPADAAMDEGAVADNAYHAAGLVGWEHVTQAQPDAQTGPHAHARVDGLEGLEHPQRVAPDVARHDAILLAQRLKDDAVLAGVAELRRFAGRLGRLRTEIIGENAPHAGHVQLAEPIHVRLAFHWDARGANGFHQVRIAFLDDHAAPDALHELRDLLHRQRVSKPQLEHAGLGGGLAHVHEGNPRSDDAEALGALHDVVQAAGLAPLLQLDQLLPQAPVRGAGVGRDHDASPDVPLEARRLGRAVILTGPHDGVTMADAGGRAIQDGYLPTLRHLDRRPEEIVSLRRIGWFEHRPPRRYRVSPVVLLVLAGGHARIVGGDDDERSAHAGVSDREERVGGHVETDVLHR